MALFKKKKTGAAKKKASIAEKKKEKKVPSTRITHVKKPGAARDATSTRGRAPDSTPNKVFSSVTCRFNKDIKLMLPFNDAMGRRKEHVVIVSVVDDDLHFEDWRRQDETLGRPSVGKKKRKKKSILKL